MTKRKLLAAVAGFALGTCAAALWLWLGSHGRISFSSYQKIQPGMTRAQVESILGGPARQEVALLGVDARSGTWLGEEWWGEDGVVFVGFDAAGKVNYKEFREHWLKVEPPDPPQRLRSWLARQSLQD